MTIVATMTAEKASAKADSRSAEAERTVSVK